MRNFALCTCLVFLSACQTSSKGSISSRNPDAVGASGWQEIIVDEPSSYLNLSETKRRIQDRKFKQKVLHGCRVDSFHGDYLETDLLFIRLNNWSEDRLQKEYLPAMSPQNLRCLMEQAVQTGV